MLRRRGFLCSRLRNYCRYLDQCSCGTETSLACWCGSWHTVRRSCVSRRPSAVLRFLRFWLVGVVWFPVWFPVWFLWWTSLGGEVASVCLYVASAAARSWCQESRLNWIRYIVKDFDLFKSTRVRIAGVSKEFNLERGCWHMLQRSVPFLTQRTQRFVGTHSFLLSHVAVDFGT